MASSERHIEQARHNESVAQLLANAQAFDWAVTVLFYSALHKVQAYLVGAGSVTKSHGQREVQMLRRSELLPIIDSYELLRRHSENARYECQVFSKADFDTILAQDYEAIVRHLGALPSRQP